MQLEKGGKTRQVFVKFKRLSKGFVRFVSLSWDLFYSELIECIQQVMNKYLMEIRPSLRNLPSYSKYIETLRIPGFISREQRQNYGNNKDSLVHLLK